MTNQTERNNVPASCSVTKQNISSQGMTDQELFELAKQFGKNALLWRRKFIGLLPEINRRRLWEKKGFSSIFEFSKKLGGLSERQIRLALNLEKRFEGKPSLKTLLISGEVGLNKLERVASIATSKNEAELAMLVRTLPKSAIETLVKDEKYEGKGEEGEVRNGLFKPLIGVKFTPGRKFSTMRVGQSEGLELSEEVSEKLLLLQEKGIDVNEVLLELLEKREMEIEEEKEAIAKDLSDLSDLSARMTRARAMGRAKTSRHVPARVLRIIQKEHGSKCSIPGCKKRAEQLHHTQTFALSRRHDPRFLAPLCKNHHQIVHSINLKVVEKIASASQK